MIYFELGILVDVNSLSIRRYGKSSKRLNLDQNLQRRPPKISNEDLNLSSIGYKLWSKLLQLDREVCLITKKSSIWSLDDKTIWCRNQLGTKITLIQYVDRNDIVLSESTIVVYYKHSSNKGWPCASILFDGCINSTLEKLKIMIIEQDYPLLHMNPNDTHIENTDYIIDKVSPKENIIKCDDEICDNSSLFKKEKRGFDIFDGNYEPDYMEYLKVIQGIQLIYTTPHRFYHIDGSDLSRIKTVKGAHSTIYHLISFHTLSTLYCSVSDMNDIEYDNMIQYWIYLHTLFISSSYAIQLLGLDEKYHDRFTHHIISNKLYHTVINYFTTLSKDNPAYNIYQNTLQLNNNNNNNNNSMVSTLLQISSQELYMIKLAVLNYTLGAQVISLSSLYENHVRIDMHTCSIDNLYNVTHNLTTSAIDSTELMDRNYTMKNQSYEYFPSVFQCEKHLRCFHNAVLWLNKVCSQIQDLKYSSSTMTSTFSSATSSSSSSSISNNYAHRIHSLLYLLRQVCTSSFLIKSKDNNRDIIQGRYYCNLCYSGLSLLWTDQDEATSDKAFLEAKLHHLYPIWPIAKGLSSITMAIAKEAKSCKTSHPDISQEGYRICIEISKLLLWTQLEYSNKYNQLDLPPFSTPQPFSSSSSSSSSSSLVSSSLVSATATIATGMPSFSTTKISGARVVGGVNSTTTTTPTTTSKFITALHMNRITHAFNVLQSIRGHTWERLLSDLCQGGYPPSEIHTMYERALDDPYLTKEFLTSLSEKKLYFMTNTEDTNMTGNQHTLLPSKRKLSKSTTYHANKKYLHSKQLHNTHIATTTTTTTTTAASAVSMTINDIDDSPSKKRYSIHSLYNNHHTTTTASNDNYHHHDMTIHELIQNYSHQIQQQFHIGTTTTTPNTTATTTSTTSTTTTKNTSVTSVTTTTCISNHTNNFNPKQYMDFSKVIPFHQMKQMTSSSSSLSLSSRSSTNSTKSIMNVRYICGKLIRNPHIDTTSAPQRTRLKFKLPLIQHSSNNHGILPPNKTTTTATTIDKITVSNGFQSNSEDNLNITYIWEGLPNIMNYAHYMSNAQCNIMTSNKSRAPPTTSTTTSTSTTASSSSSSSSTTTTCKSYLRVKEIEHNGIHPYGIQNDQYITMDDKVDSKSHPLAYTTTCTSEICKLNNDRYDRCKDITNPTVTLGNTTINSRDDNCIHILNPSDINDTTNINTTTSHSKLTIFHEEKGEDINKHNPDYVYVEQLAMIHYLYHIGCTFNSINSTSHILTYSTSDTTIERTRDINNTDLCNIGNTNIPEHVNEMSDSHKTYNIRMKMKNCNKFSIPKVNDNKEYIESKEDVEGLVRAAEVVNDEAEILTASNMDVKIIKESLNTEIIDISTIHIGTVMGMCTLHTAQSNHPTSSSHQDEIMHTHFKSGILQSIHIDNSSSNINGSNSKTVPGISDSSTGYVGAWSEALLWKNLLFLCMWNEIYDPNIPYGLIRHYQLKPIDMMPEGNGNIFPSKNHQFYKRRKRLFLKRFQILRNMSNKEIFYEIYRLYFLYYNCPCFGVSWESINIFELCSLGAAIGGSRLCIIFDAMLQDYELHYRGMPDLLFWKIEARYYDYASDICNVRNKSNYTTNDLETNNSHLSHPHFPYNTTPPTIPVPVLPCQQTPKSSSTLPWMQDTVFAVEVKSDKDILSKWQILWLELLCKANIPVEICKVINI